MVGRIAERPLLKNGDAAISSALNTYSRFVLCHLNATMKPSATTARIRSLAIIIRLRSKRSSRMPASGPIITAGIARESITPVTTMPGSPCSMARLNTATLLKWSPISLTTWPHHVKR